jgi:hypothetical protein
MTMDMQKVGKKQRRSEGARGKISLPLLASMAEFKKLRALLGC